MTKPANILFINLYTEMGGNEVAVLNLAKSLDRSRFTPVLMFNCRGPFVEKAEGAGVQTVFFSYESVMLQRLIIPSVCWNNVKASYEIYKYLRQADISVVQCSDVLSLLLIFFPVMLLRIPVVYSFVFYYEWMRIMLFNILAVLIVDRIVANSFGVKEDLDAKSIFLAGKTSVIHNGIDTAVFHPATEALHADSKLKPGTLRTELGIPSSTKIVGMVARFDPVKGHETFLRAASAIVRNRSDIRFLVAGGLLMSDTLPAWKTYHEQILRLHKELGLEERVMFLSHRDDVASFMRECDVLVCPSTREAFGLVVPEAVASGVPVVVSRGVGALEAVSGESGIYVAEPADEGSLVRNIETALNEASSRKGAPLRPSARFQYAVSLKRYASEFELMYNGFSHPNERTSTIHN